MPDKLFNDAFFKDRIAELPERSKHLIVRVGSDDTVACKMVLFGCGVVAYDINIMASDNARLKESLNELFGSLDKLLALFGLPPCLFAAFFVKRFNESGVARIGNGICPHIENVFLSADLAS